jgi:uncharacterized protein (DUF1810 family)
MTGSDPHDLERFVTAQADVYDDVLAELRGGRKTSHWMWFVFPQVRELGRTPMAQRYGIGSRAEAVAYLRHPVLGERLRECAALAAAIEGASAREVFGSPDDLKLRSSMTLFALAADAAGLADVEFVTVLDRFYAGGRDETSARMWNAMA